MKSISIIIFALLMVTSCKKSNGVTKSNTDTKSSYTADSLKMEEAIKATMKKLNL
jgi:hypothetical protein